MENRRAVEGRSPPFQVKPRFPVSGMSALSGSAVAEGRWKIRR